MGLCIYANNSVKSFYCGYGGFISLRTNIALAFDKEFGECYSILNPWNEAQVITKINGILSQDRFSDVDEDILDFLFASDCNGEISYKTCKKIYDLIKDIDFCNEIFTYGAHSDGKDYEYFKEFLLECYSHRRKMRWD